MSYSHFCMDLSILGSGTCVPSLSRSSCSVLIRSGDEKMLLDLGAGTIRRLLEAGENIREISVVFFSHFHPDHTGEFVSFLFANKYPDRAARQRMLTVMGGKGLSRFYSGLRDVYGHVIELPGRLFRLVETDAKGYDTRQLGVFLVQSVPVAHCPESIACKITAADGRSVVYSGDTDYCDSLIELARDADVLICESSFPDGMKVKGHLTPSMAGEIAARANVRKLVLTHFYPECDTVDIEAQCRRAYSGSLVLATDMLKVEI